MAIGAYECGEHQWHGKRIAPFLAVKVLPVEEGLIGARDLGSSSRKISKTLGQQHHGDEDRVDQEGDDEVHDVLLWSFEFEILLCKSRYTMLTYICYFVNS